MRRIQIGNETFDVDLSPIERRCGNGVFVKLSNGTGKVVRTVAFTIHPEFNDYDYYQSLTYERLTVLVLERLESGKDVEVLRSTYPGTLLLRINDPDADTPRKILMGTTFKSALADE